MLQGWIKMASLADQLGWCITTKDYLNNLNKELLFVSSRYEEAVSELGRLGYLQEMLPQMQNMQRDFESEVSNLVSHIEGEHLAYVDKQSQAIVAQMP